MDFGDELPLNAVVPVETWAMLRRRLRYLEAVVVQILGDRSLLKEWYTAGELADLALPGLPRTRQGVARLANAEGWRSQIIMQRGQEARVYHCTSLPARAFDGMLDRIVMRAQRRAEEAVPAVPAPPRASSTTPPPADAAPPWVLPLLRLIRKEGKLSVAGVVQELPKHLPPGTPCPTYEEAEGMLRKLGMVAGD